MTKSIAIFWACGLGGALVQVRIRIYEKISQNFLNFLYLASACILTKRAAHLLNKAA
jgi:hypothetical protein